MHTNTHTYSSFLVQDNYEFPNYKSFKSPYLKLESGLNTFFLQYFLEMYKNKLFAFDLLSLTNSNVSALINNVFQHYPGNNLL